MVSGNCGPCITTTTTLAQRLLGAAAAEPEELLKQLGTTHGGLDTQTAAQRLSAFGPNLVARERQQNLVQELIGRTKNPLNFLLLSLAAVSYFFGDTRAAAVIAVMVVLSVFLAFLQEHRSNNAAAKLRAMVRTTATVLRRHPGSAAGEPAFEIPIEEFVPSHVVRLSAGDMIPADLRVLTAKDLFLNEASLTGEATPVEKSAAPLHGQREAPTDLPNICFMSSNVLSGAGTAVVIQTGAGTCFGELAGMLMRRRAPTSFDKGVTRFVAGAGALLPYTPLGSTLGFVPLPALYWPPVVVIILGYCVLAHLVKSWFVRRWGL